MSYQASCRIILLACICLSFNAFGQRFAHEVIETDQLIEDITSLSKDNWNRLIINCSNQAFAYDGQMTYTIINEGDANILGIEKVNDGDQHLVIFENKIALHQPRWQLDDQVVKTFDVKGTITQYEIFDQYLIFQNSDHVVYLLNTKEESIDELPYIGPQLDGFSTKDDIIYLFGLDLMSYHIDKKQFESTALKLPVGNNLILSDDENTLLLSENSQLWNIDVVHGKSGLIDRIPKSSAFIGGQIVANKLYLFSRGHGITTYDLNKKRVHYIHVGNGLCRNEISAYHMSSDQHIWLANNDELCLTTNKAPTLSDRDLGLKDERIAAISSLDEKVVFSTQSSNLYALSNQTLKEFNASNGLVENSITAIEKHRNRLFLASQSSGILEFDGYGFYYPDSSIFHNQSITSLCSLDDENLFIGTKSNGLYCMSKDTSSKWNYEHKFPSRIKNMVDLIGIYDGQILIIEKNKISRYNKATNNLRTVHQWPSQQIKDAALWNGYIYLITNQELIRLPMEGIDDEIEYFNQENGLTANQHTAVQAANDRIFLTHRNGTSSYPIAFFDKPKAGHDIRTYRYKVQKNGLTTHQGKLLGATDQGVIELNADATHTQDGRLILESVVVNNDAYSTIDSLPFDGRQNRWLIQYASIAPEGGSDLQYAWTLNGNEHQFSGQTDQRSIYFPFLPPDEYKLSIIGEGDQIRTNELTRTFTIKPRFYNTRTFYYLVFGGLLFLSGLLALILSKLWSSRLRKKNAQLRWENEKLEWQQKALQLQMNPHFIFNALNSIQSLVGKDDKRARYYIAKLGKLMRSTLNHAREKWIAIDDEIELLTTYLELEKLNHGFSYAIDKHNIESSVHIPPMMIQPLVENAVKHGVHKVKDEGHIDITFKYEGRKIKCIVRDNGPGVNADQSIEGHVSVSTQVINERMLVYQKEGVKADPIEVINLADQGTGGTEVRIGLPYNEKIENEFK